VMIVTPLQPPFHYSSVVPAMFWAAGSIMIREHFLFTLIIHPLVF
jgi:hypothetical protein